MIVVNVSEDGMVAELVVPPDYQPTVFEIQERLVHSGVVFGLDDELLSKLGSGEATSGVYEVAKGMAPVPGVSAQIEYFFRTGKVDLAPKILDDGRADYFNLGVAQNALEGEILARKTRLIEGKLGMTVGGKQVKTAIAKDMPLRPGPGTTLSEDGLELVAAISGCPALIRGLVSVKPIFDVNGDVDFSIGNIDFEGQVNISGNVCNNFEVRAKGNIVVHGNVEGAALIAGGVIMVVGGVRQQAELTALGDIKVGFMERSKAQTPASFFVKDDLLFSDVEVGGSVEVEGQVIGGNCKADQVIKAKQIGSRMGTATYLNMTPRERAQAAMIAQEKRLTEAKSQLEKVEEGLDSLETLRSKRQALSENQSELYVKLMDAAANLKLQLAETTKDAMQARAKYESVPNPKIIITHLLHPGVHIRLNEAFLNSESPIPATKISESDGRIQYG